MNVQLVVKVDDHDIVVIYPVDLNATKEQKTMQIEVRKQKLGATDARDVKQSTLIATTAISPGEFATFPDAVEEASYVIIRLD